MFFGSIFVYFFIVFCSIEIYAKESVFNVDLENKIISLVDGHVNELIVAGDSRAHRQVDPEYIYDEYGYSAINIAVNSGELITTYNALKKYDLLGTNNIILSVSFFQANDGASEPGYLSTAAIVNMSLAEKFKYLSEDSVFYLKLYQKEFFQQIVFPQLLSRPQESTFENLGFLPTQGQMSMPIPYSADPQKTTHPWYKDIDLHGSRARILRETIFKFSQEDCNLILYQPPVSPAFREKIKSSPIEQSEYAFSRLLAQESSKYQNIYFIDFFSDKVSVLTDDMYYDPQHLNPRGARIFTKELIDRTKRILGSKM